MQKHMLGGLQEPPIANSVNKFFVPLRTIYIFMMFTYLRVHFIDALLCFHNLHYSCHLCIIHNNEHNNYTIFNTIFAVLNFLIFVIAKICIFLKEMY